MIYLFISVCVQQSIPMRHKAIYLLNVPGPIKFAFDFFQTRLSSKINGRMKVYEYIITTKYILCYIDTVN